LAAEAAGIADFGLRNAECDDNGAEGIPDNDLPGNAVAGAASAEAVHGWTVSNS